MSDHPGDLLIIDDDISVREILKDYLEEEGHSCREAEDGEAGLARVGETEPELVLLDVHMPGMNGIEVLRRLRSAHPDVLIVMVTSVDELQTVRESLRAGAYDYLIKPVHIDELLSVVDKALDHSRLAREHREYHERLEQEVHERTKELKHALDRIEATYGDTILALGSALETRDVETQAHSLRVAHYTLMLTRGLGITSQKRLTDIERGAYLHDIGKIGVPDRILLKPGALDEDEWKLMKRHPAIGARLLAGIEFLADAVPIVEHHHERWDGGGYPGALGGAEIPLEARAFAIADTLDAITSDRPYRAGRPISVARQIIREESGTQFDPDVVGVLENITDEELRNIDIQLTRHGDQATGLKMEGKEA